MTGSECGGVVGRVSDAEVGPVEHNRAASSKVGVWSSVTQTVLAKVLISSY